MMLHCIDSVLLIDLLFSPLLVLKEQVSMWSDTAYGKGHEARNCRRPLGAEGGLWPTALLCGRQEILTTWVNLEADPSAVSDSYENPQTQIDQIR